MINGEPKAKDNHRKARKVELCLAPARIFELPGLVGGLCVQGSVSGRESRGEKGKGTISQLLQGMGRSKGKMKCFETLKVPSWPLLEQY